MGDGCEFGRRDNGRNYCDDLHSTEQRGDRDSSVPHCAWYL
jgi:hypothetical protein